MKVSNSNNELKVFWRILSSTTDLSFAVTLTRTKNFENNFNLLKIVLTELFCGMFWKNIMWKCCISKYHYYNYAFWKGWRFKAWFKTYYLQTLFSWKSEPSNKRMNFEGQSPEIIFTMHLAPVTSADQKIVEIFSKLQLVYIH